MIVQGPNSTAILPPTDKAILVYTDGGFVANPDALGSWAYVAVPPGKETNCGDFVSGGYRGTTNNRMEMLAVIRALERVEMGPRVIVTSDSEYVVKGATVWVDSWVRKGWVTASGAPVKNRDLWQRLMALRDLHDVRFDWVKGHAGNPLNEIVDGMCVNMLGELTQKLNIGGHVEYDLGMQHFP